MPQTAEGPLLWLEPRHSLRLLTFSGSPVVVNRAMSRPAGWRNKWEQKHRITEDQPSTVDDVVQLLRRDGLLAE